MQACSFNSIIWRGIASLTHGISEIHVIFTLFSGKLHPTTIRQFERLVLSLKRL